MLGPDHPDTLATSYNIAHWTGMVDGVRALQLFGELLPSRQRVLGRDHPDTLLTRHNIAAWTSEAARVEEAIRLFRGLLPDRERLLGPDHPDTLESLRWLAVLTFRNDDHIKGYRLLRGTKAGRSTLRHRLPVGMQISRRDPGPRLSETRDHHSCERVDDRPTDGDATEISLDTVGSSAHLVESDAAEPRRGGYILAEEGLQIGFGLLLAARGVRPDAYPPREPWRPVDAVDDDRPESSAASSASRVTTVGAPGGACARCTTTDRASGR